MSVVNLSSLNFAPSKFKQCRAALKNVRWSTGFVCPACGHDKAYQLKTRDQLECANKKCKRQTSPTAGTQFHNTRARSLEAVWAVLSQFRKDLAALTEDRIQALLNVSARTARRIAEIISLSFRSGGAFASSARVSRRNKERTVDLRSNRVGKVDVQSGKTNELPLLTEHVSAPGVLFRCKLKLQIACTLRQSPFLFSRLIV